MLQGESRPGATAPNPLHPTRLDETAFLVAWDGDIMRAARCAAKGDPTERQDLTQQVRARVLLAYRQIPDAPVPYIRTVITNTLRSAFRSEARSFTARSPLAEEINDDLAAPTDEGVDERVAAVTVWVARLPAPFREIYQHLYREELSQRAAAKLMHVSQPRVTQLNHQLLELARKELAHLRA
jgi:RNA polymerase sigma factor (sigma-70 family)